MKASQIRRLATLLLPVLILSIEVFAQANSSASIAQLFTGKIETKIRHATLSGKIPKTCVPHIALKADGEPDSNKLVAFTVVDRDGEGLRCLTENSKKPCKEDSCASLADLAKDERTKDQFQVTVEIKSSDLDGVRVGVNTQFAPKPHAQAPAPPPQPQARLEASTTATCCGAQLIPGPQQSVERSLDSSTMSRVLEMAGADKSSDRTPPSDSRTSRNDRFDRDDRDDRDSRRSRDDDESARRRRSFARDDDFDDRYDRSSSSRNPRSRNASDDSFSMGSNSSSNMALLAMMAQGMFSMGNSSMSLSGGIGSSMYGGGSSLLYGTLGASAYGGLNSWPTGVNTTYPGSSSIFSGLSSSLYGTMSPSLTGGFRSPLLSAASLGGWGSLGTTMNSPLLYGNIGSSFNYGSPSISLFGTSGSSLGSYPSYYGYGR